MKRKTPIRKADRAKTKSTGVAPARMHAAKAPALDADTVLSLLKRLDRPLSEEALCMELPIGGAKARARCQAVLEALVHSGQIIRNRRDEFCLRERVGLIVGRASGHREGHGFLMPDDRSAPIYLSYRQMQQVMHGDRVAVRIVGTDRRGRPEGTIVEVLERGTAEIVGRLYEEASICFVIPENARISHRILVPRDRLGGAQPGQVVLLKIVEQPSRTAQPVGYVTRILGEHGAPGMEIEIAIHSHGLPHEFSEQTLREAARFGQSVSAAAKRDREDLRALPLVTIDGEDARDFDDAVWCERTGGGWRLLVAIADVGSYVQPETALDGEAVERGTSVYFPNRVLPMLPEALSNGLCSLNPNVDRLCMVCEMRVNAEGKITRARFFEGLMCSAARLTYTEVAAFLANPAVVAGSAHAEKFARSGDSLHALYEVFKALYQARVRRGAIEFDAPELKVRFDAEGKIAALVEQSRNDAHRLIEECMIAANVQAARFLRRHKIPTLYRVHGQPEEDRLRQLREFLRGFAIQLPADHPLTPQDLNAVLQRVADHEEARLIETVVVRAMPQAVYQPENIGHFGLALPEYAHFTSPIRRYPDLIVHRGIRHVLRGGTVDDLPPALQGMEAKGQQCSLLERRADDATRDAMSWLKCEYMSDKIGEEFPALITGIVDFGLFVQVKGMQIDGLVHVSSLGSDYFSRDKSGYRLVGQRSGRVFRLGDTLHVRLINVVMDERKIDFELVQTAAGSPSAQTVRGPWRRRDRSRRSGT